MEEKRNFAWPVTSINKADFYYFNLWFNASKDIIFNSKVIIYGAGIRGTEFSLFFEKQGYNNIIFTDSNIEKVGGVINDYEIISPQIALELVREKNYIILISVENCKDIVNMLLEEKLIVNKNFFVVSNRLYDQYINEFFRETTNDKLFLGDCEFLTISINDEDNRTLTEMIMDYAGKNRCKVLAMHGMGMRSHYNVLKMQIKKGMIPSKLFVMINLDTLTGIQHLLPRSQHEELLVSLYKKCECADEEYEIYLKDVGARSKNHQVEFSLNTDETDKERIKQLRARNYFRLNYMYNLDENVEGIEYLRMLLKVAEKYNIDVTAFIPPVNYQYGEQLWGNRFIECYSKNIEKIKKIIDIYNCKVIDMSYALDSADFAEEHTPDETANENGRRKVVELLLGQLS